MLHSRLDKKSVKLANWFWPRDDDCKNYTVVQDSVRGALSMHHARPITILSCLYRLLGKFIVLVSANVWKMFFPFDVSGGLPGRGVKELAYTQKRLIEDALDDGQNLGGYPLDLIKAYTGSLRFFTDGGARFLRIPMARIATWAVVQDIPPSVEHQI